MWILTEKNPAERLREKFHKIKCSRLVKHFQTCERTYIFLYNTLVRTADRDLDIAAEDKAGRRIGCNVLGVDDKAFVAADKRLWQPFNGFFHRRVRPVKLLGRMVNGTAPLYAYVNYFVRQQADRCALRFYPDSAFVFLYVIDFINRFLQKIFADRFNKICAGVKFVTVEKSLLDIKFSVVCDEHNVDLAVYSGNFRGCVYAVIGRFH